MGLIFLLIKNEQVIHKVLIEEHLKF